MKAWRKIFQQKIDEGCSCEDARNFATMIIKERRSKFNPYSIVGMTETAAKEKLDENGYSFRVQQRDVGNVDIMYLDYCETRCNVSIVQGNVDAILSMG